MPVPGLLLAGFMDEDEAIQYMRANTYHADTSDAALSACWKDAVSRIGSPIANAGVPDIQSFETRHRPYLQKVPNNPRFAATIEGMSKWEFALVEVDRLLAFQVDVWTDRSSDLCKEVSSPPTTGEMLRICLPQTVEAPPRPKIVGNSTGTGFLIESDNLNYRLLEGKYIEKAGVPNMGPVDLAGIFAGIGSPLLQVVSFGRRYYLKNGYHRVAGLRAAGATHVPCLLMEAPHIGLVGVARPGFFGTQVFEKPHVPTCSQFATERAYPVQFIRKKRLIQVTWSEYVLPAED